MSILPRMKAIREAVIILLRKIGGHPRVLPYIAIYRAAPTVTASLRYVLREAFGHKGSTCYQLRENGLRVWIRHGEGDVVVLGEVFTYHDYEPPVVLAQLLSDVHIIVDLGANIGMFGAFACSRWSKAEIFAYEPDRHNAEMHERSIAANDLADRWHLVRAAAGDRDGHISFVAGLGATSRAAGAGSSEATIEVPIVDVLPVIQGVDLLKMDIEGGEWAILTDPRFREAPPKAMVLEYHQHLCPGPDARAEAEAALSAAGLRIHEVSQEHDDHGILWAWKPA